MFNVKCHSYVTSILVAKMFNVHITNVLLLQSYMSDIVCTGQGNIASTVSFILFIFIFRLH